MLLLSATVSQPLAAQVGIRTEDPQGMLHVDAKGNTVVGPTDTLGFEDDVIVTLQGNVGIGTLPETASDTLPLRLTDGGTPALPRSPLRIEDGNEREGRVLTSDASGRGAWKNLPPQFTPGRVYGLQGVPAMSIVCRTTYDIFNFTADEPGFHLFEIRWWGKFKGVTVIPFIVFQLYKGNTPVDTFEQYAGVNFIDTDNVFSLCLTLYGKALAAGETFTLRMHTINANNVTNAGQDTQVNPAWTQSKVNVLRVK